MTLIGGRMWLRCHAQAGERRPMRRSRCAGRAGTADGVSDGVSVSGALGNKAADPAPQGRCKPGRAPQPLMSTTDWRPWTAADSYRGREPGLGKAVQVAVTSGAGAMAALPHRLSGGPPPVDVVTADDLAGGTPTVETMPPARRRHPPSAHMGAAGAWCRRARCGRLGRSERPRKSRRKRVTVVPNGRAGQGPPDGAPSAPRNSSRNSPTCSSQAHPAARAQGLRRLPTRRPMPVSDDCRRRSI